MTTATDPTTTAATLRAQPDRTRPAAPVEVTADVAGGAEILTPEALDFLAGLHARFAGRRAELLAARQERRERIADGHNPDFLPETKAIRDDPAWRVQPPAPGLVDRRVEITGPTERKMTINALNSGANVWMADLEDANTPHFANVVAGQVNLRDAIRQRIDYTSPEGKRYPLRPADEQATIVVRPRGWHLTEKHLRIDGQSAVAGLVDFGLHVFHNARELVDRGRGPYFYLPKLESHLEARLWHDVFSHAEDVLGLARGTIRATVLIETITAAFEMDEILYELGEHAAGLNAGRWDYMFSMIKNFRRRGRAFVLPDRSAVTMTVPFMRAYTELLVRTCHRRGAYAIGGMSAFVPGKDAQQNELAFARVREDKQREAADGYDGSWVAHPGLVDVAREAFDAVLGARPNQLDRTRDDVEVTAADLLDVSSTPGMVTEDGLRTNIAVSIRYLEAWLGGQGAVAIFGLMEDAATAEISRSQIWQWIATETPLDDSRLITPELVSILVEEEVEKLLAEIGDDAERRSRAATARRLFEDLVLGPEYPTFLTIPAYASHV